MRFDLYRTRFNDRERYAPNIAERDPVQWTAAYRSAQDKRYRAGLLKGHEWVQVRTLLDTEEAWMLWCEPYFKVFPRMASEMADTSIDIPAKFLKLPYPAFVVLFPEGAPVKAVLFAEQEIVRRRRCPTCGSTSRRSSIGTSRRRSASASRSGRRT